MKSYAYKTTFNSHFLSDFFIHDCFNLEILQNNVWCELKLVLLTVYISCKKNYTIIEF